MCRRVGAAIGAGGKRSARGGTALLSKGIRFQRFCYFREADQECGSAGRDECSAHSDEEREVVWSSEDD
eukprot:4217078-Pyramimonas_sp.AAC.1